MKDESIAEGCCCGGQSPISISKGKPIHQMVLGKKYNIRENSSTTKVTKIKKEVMTLLGPVVYESDEDHDRN